MKSLIQFLLSSVLLINTPTLFAQISSTSNEVTQDSLVDNSIPISNLPSSISHLGITPKLMMNPSLEEGTKTLGEALGVFGKRTITDEGTAVEGAGRNNVVNAVSSSNVLRLRGGGPKKSQITGGLKSTGDSSDEEDAPDLESEDSAPMGGEVNKYLKNEIINNIYTECLAEVAKLSLGGRVTIERASQEAAEWAAAEKAAEYSKGKIERAFEKAVREIEEAKSIADEAKRNLRELEKAPKPASTMDQTVAAAALAYEKAYAAYTASGYKAKKLAGDLAEARVETASAVLHAITVRKSTQHASAAESGLEEAKETEMAAAQAVEAAKADVETKADLLSKAEENLNEAKRAAIGNGASNPISPMTAAQKVAMKEIELDQKIAEKALLKAKEVELTAHVAKGKIREMNFERELKAYHDAEEAWTETVEGYKTALAKAEEAGLNDRKEELATALANAEVHQATWRADSRWVKARRADQGIVTGASLNHLDQLTVVEEAWANVIEGYKMAIAKATKANMKCVELMASLNDAVSAQERIAVILAEKSKQEVNEALLAASVAWNNANESSNRAEGAKIVADRTKTEYNYNKLYRLARDTSYAWMQAAETKKIVLLRNPEADKVSLVGKINIAESNKALYEQLAAEAVENVKNVAKETEFLKKEEADRKLLETLRVKEMQFREKEMQAQGLGKTREATSWNGAYESIQLQIFYLANAIGAREAGKIILAEGYREAAATSKYAVDQWINSVQAYAAGKEEYGNLLALVGRSLHAEIGCQAKASEAQEKGKTTLAEGYREAVAMYEAVVIEYVRSANCDLSVEGNKQYAICWYNKGCSLQVQADYQVKAIEAQEKGKTTLVAGYREVVKISGIAASNWELSAKAFEKIVPVCLNITPETKYAHIAQERKYADCFQRAMAQQEEANAIAKRTDAIVIEKGAGVRTKANEGKNITDTREKPLQESIKNLSLKSPSAAEVTPIKGSEASSSSCTLNFSAPSTPCSSSASATMKTGSNVVREKDVVVQGAKNSSPKSPSVVEATPMKGSEASRNSSTANATAPSISCPSAALAILKTGSKSVDTSATTVENTPNKQAESPSPKKLSWYEKKAVTTEQEANSAFANAESNPTEESWLKAKTKAQIAEHDWNEVVKSKRLPAEIEEAKAQKAIWTEKIEFANLQASKVRKVS